MREEFDGEMVLKVKLFAEILGVFLRHIFETLKAIKETLRMSINLLKNFKFY